MAKYEGFSKQLLAGCRGFSAVVAWGFRSSCWQAVVAREGVFEAVAGRLSWHFKREQTVASDSQTVASNSQTVASNSQTVASDSQTVAGSRQAIVAW